MSPYEDGFMSKDIVISAQNIEKTYGKGEAAFRALKGVSLDVKRGESLAIVGKSGSGKSTLMHLLALLDKPDAGSIAINGRNSTKLHGRELNLVRNRTFGFVFQQFFLNPSSTVIDNVELPLKIAGVSRKERKRRAMEVLEMLELDSKAKNKATDLSGGQKQRVVIARALVNNPELLLADEPTGNLDSGTGKIVEEILFDLNKAHGITFILVTHDLDLANKCDRQIFLKDGLIIEELSGEIQ